MPMLLDFNQSIIANVAMAEKNFPEIDGNMVRHLFFGTVCALNKKFRSKYGDLIICCDSKNNWRRDYFPYYKAGRKKNRQDTGLNWEQVFESIDQLTKELEESFPYKVVKVDRAEGDDIIAALCKYFYKNELSDDGVLEEPQPVIILSNDKDFKQLQIFENVKQYTQIRDHYVEERNPAQYLKEQIIRGDSADGVPNFLSQDDSFVMKVRQKPIRAVKLEDWLKCDSPEEFCEDGTDQLDNWRRNKKMVDLLNEIPPDIETATIEAYNNAHVAKRSGLLDYCMKHKLKNVAKQIQNL